ncbi:nuclear transport factor 2 family protein [Streptacidiphilus sp. EB129]|uniref:nuclear transport factor 2 family protein n=1 Tax=Streptacidiphilus sp. EB129 TaxID=3156262 RepID=UPI0035185CD4
MNLRSPHALIALAASAFAVTGVAGTAFADDHHGVPRVVDSWAAAWNGTDPAALGRVFTANGTYTDEAVGVTFSGPQQISGWKTKTDRLISDAHVTILNVFKDGRHITIESTYAGHIKGAPKAFSVQMATVLGGVGGNRATSDKDYYNLAAVLSQSGLPSGWTPPVG